jgi:hypothetical protein
MLDRSMLRDAAFAILLGVPTLALARPQSEPAPLSAPAAQPLVEQAAIADQSQAERRFTVSDKQV